MEMGDIKKLQKIQNIDEKIEEIHNSWEKGVQYPTK